MRKAQWSIAGDERRRRWLVECHNSGYVYNMNSRLTVAAHVLGMIAFCEREEGRGVTSEELAESVGTNAVVVRRVLSQLKQAGLIDSRRGAGGGSVLARPASDITLRMVHEAVQDDCAEFIGRHASAVGQECQVAPVIASYLDELYREAEEALRATLARVTIEQMSLDVMQRLRSRHGSQVA
jgi:Rrf2 family protein